MDGRWSWRLAAGLLGGALGCSGLQHRQAADAPPAGQVQTASGKLPKPAPPLTPTQAAAASRAKEWNGAVECFSRAAQMDPDNKQAQRFLGLTLTRAGRYDEGLAALAKCMPEAEARYNLAKMLRHNQQAAAAEQQAQMALQADPQFEPAQMLLAEFNAAA